MQLRKYAGAADTTAMQRLASRLWPLGLHPGGLGWSAAIGQLADHIAVAEDGDLVGWAGVSQPGEFLAQIDPSTPDAARALIDWAVEVAEGTALRIDVADDDDVLLDAIAATGFVLDSDQVPEVGHGMRVGLHRTIADRAPERNDGYQIQSVQRTDLAARVEVHRRAWDPALLPWHPDHRPVIDPESTSRFGPEDYAEVRRTWLYDPEFDLVVVAPDGSLAGSCIAWFDPASGCAEIEPLGVVVEHRSRGLAGFLCLEVAARVGAAGGSDIFINTGPSAAYPAPAGAYRKAGFGTFSRGAAYQLQRCGSTKIRD